MNEVNESRVWRAVGTVLVFVALISGSQLFPVPRCAADEPAKSVAADSVSEVAQSILTAIADDSLRSLVQEVLIRNPGIAAQTATVGATAQRGDQAAALPDPMLGATAWILNPETRVGPQQVTTSLVQQFPWFGKRKLRGAMAEYEAQAAQGKLGALQLQRLTETRKLYYEIAFLWRYEQVVREDRATLVHYEELARARYASGVGLEQSVVKIQAEITKADVRLLEIGTRRASLVAQINALRDRPAATPVGSSELPRFADYEPDPELLRELAMRQRPELSASEAQIERWRASLGVAKKESKPNLTLGITYTFVGERSDEPGRMNPPPDNGQDALGIVAGINLPLWRGKYAAAREEALQSEWSAREEKRGVIAAIERDLGDVMQRLTLTQDRLRLLEDVLGIQARQSLRSAESGYAAGTLNALDLLDAERVLLDVRIAAARARADHAIALAELEGTVAAPVVSTP
jgi:outer membrane protein TolC